MQLISMYSPTSQPIIGAKLQDGSITQFECHFGRKLGEPMFIYLYPNGASKSLSRVGGEPVFVDASGQEWASSDVEYKSIPPI